MSVAPGAPARARPPRPRPRRARPDARADALAGGPRRRPRVQRVPRRHAAPPGPVPGGRPDLDAVLRPDRPPGRRGRVSRRRTRGWGHAGCGDGAVLRRPPARGRRRTATRSSSTGGPRCPPRSTAPRGPTPMGVRAAPPVRHRPRRAHRVRGRAPHRPGRGRPVRSDILASEIERPREGPMRDIVATIQPEQDVIVRADVATTICVQGAPGTGKTAVGLHRAAWLLYAFRDRLARAGVLVIGPNRAFLDHIGAVLPALGEVEVSHATIEDLLATRARPRRRQRGDRCAQRRLASGRGAAPGGVVARPRARPRPWSCPAARTSGASRRTRCSEILDELRDRAASATTPRGRCCRTGWPTRCCCGWSRPATPPTTGCRTRSPGRPWCAGTPATVWPALDPRAGAVRAARRPRRARPRPPTGCSTTTSSAGCCGRHAPQVPWQRPVVGRRRGAAGRDPRPPRAHPQPRARGARRGAGPLADAAAGGRAPVLHRVGDGPRRHRPGHHAVGDRLVDVLAAPPRQARRARRGAGPRVPRAGNGDRLRRPAAAVDGPRARRPGVGA